MSPGCMPLNGAQCMSHPTIHNPLQNTSIEQPTLFKQTQKKTSKLASPSPTTPVSSSSPRSSHSCASPQIHAFSAS
jgi:hypothetical protein